MTARRLPSFRLILLAAVGALLAACQSVPGPGGFTAEQIAALQSQGFVETEIGWELTLTDRLLFDTNESTLKAEEIDRLAKVARSLGAVGISTARIEGHTDSVGSDAYNLTLSQARAEAVAAPLQTNGMRFTPDQIAGRGEAVPLSSNVTPEGRQDNRRVVIIVTAE